MKSDSARDEQTVTIATTLALLVAVTLVGLAALWLAHSIADISDGTQASVLAATFTVAVLISGRYLIRHRRP